MQLLKSPKLRAPELTAPDWAGEPALLGALGGRVVLLDFFSYGDPAGIRSLRWIRGVADQYRDAGLTVIGIHVPAYAFERPIETARREVWRLGIPWPVALDHGFEIFRAYENRDLPARFVLDARGTVRGWSHGPGQFSEVERAIRTLLKEAKPERALPPFLETIPELGTPGRPNWLPSAEVRFGPRGRGFGEPAGEADPPPETGDERTFGAPPEMRAEGRPYLEGRWTLAADGAVLAGEQGSVSVVFEGASVTAVLSRIDEDVEPTVDLLLDGEPVPDVWMGDDTEGEGDRTFHRVDRGSVYEWIQGVPFGIHHLDVRVSGAGVVFHHLSFGTTVVPEEE